LSIRFSNPAGNPPPVGQYTNVAVIAPGTPTAYVAGQLPVDGEGRVVGADFDEQADAVFAMLQTALQGVGSSLERVAFIRAFMVDPSHFPAFRDARARAFRAHGVSEPPPATTIVVSELYGGSLIELDAAAAASSDWQPAETAQNARRLAATG
jgi:enamine deaminase RidA (YjgF/YER057c/UK114 family)